MTRTAEPTANLQQNELGNIIEAYSRVTERLEQSHLRLTDEVERLHRQLDEKNRELARKERLAALGEMAAGVAHEVRNPLGAIQLYASMLDRDLERLPEAQRLVQKIAGAVTSLDAVVSDILAFAGNDRLELHAISLDRVLDEVLALAAPQRDVLGATIHVDADASAVQVHADDRELTRALVNVVFNALDAAGPGGTVHIHVTEGEDGFVTIAVADDGPGVAPELAQRIFDPFFTTKDQGTGLGLSIVHRIAESHGGQVTVGPGHGGGAVFTLSLRGAGDTEPVDHRESI
ncbi:MAG: hypothetical protein JSV19_01720 [Phycisphaerales bacterium]|nr:MAG: hypothetical protein JSV19_01720 [Phycisphaerales bacterium]